MKSLETLRSQYAAFLAFSGLTAARFQSDCLALFSEMQDGEGNGEPPTPAAWVMLAAEVAYEAGTKHGRDKGAVGAYEALQGRCRASKAA